VIGLRLDLGEGLEVAAALHPAGGASGGAGDGVGTRVPVLLLPGARGDHAAEHLVAVAGLLAEAGHPVIRAALSERPPGRVGAMRAEHAQARLLRVLGAARAALAQHLLPPAASTARGAPHGEAQDWIIGGASFGGRVASLVVAARGAASTGVAGLLLVAYPLCPPKRADQVRDAHWGDVDAPALLLSGDADPFLGPDGIEGLRRRLGRLRAGGELVVVPGGRHDLSVSARSAPDGRRRSAAEAVHERTAAVQHWAGRLSGALDGTVTSTVPS